MTEHTSSISSVDAAFAALKAAGINSGTIEQGIKELVQQRDLLMGEISALTADGNLIMWDAANPEYPAESAYEVAHNCGLDAGEEFEIQVAAKLPNRIYRVVSNFDGGDLDIELVSDGSPTPRTDHLLAERDADTIQKFVSEVTTTLFPENEAARALSFLRLSIDYISQLRNGEAEC